MTPAHEPIDCSASHLASYLTHSKDFTLYWLREKLPACAQQHFDLYTKDYGDPDKRLAAFHQQVTIVPMTLPGSVSVARQDLPRDLARAVQTAPSKARACLSLCYNTRFVSGTFRAEERASACPVIDKDMAWRCAPWGKPDEFVLDTADIIHSLWEEIFPNLELTAPPSGLVVFSGATNSAKSNLAQAFALYAIRRAVEARIRNNDWKSRVPHLVTLEDPWETWKVTTTLSRPNSSDDGERVLESPDIAASLGFAFTPREKHSDVASLTAAISDAKRQTPLCFYIGEIREHADWSHVVDFAGTGHLVVTTSHASSLAETMARIIRAAPDQTAADRRFVGANLAACVHLERCNAGSRSLVLPSVWARRGAALNSLVADGLSSVTPNNSYVLSRSQFLKRCRHRFTEATSEWFRAALDKAIASDIHDLQSK